jgi:hypothetical protein
VLLAEKQPVEEATLRALRYWWSEDGSTLERILTGQRDWDLLWHGAMLRESGDPEIKLAGVALSLYQPELGDPAPFPSYTQLAEDTGFNYHSMSWAVPYLISHGLLVVDLPLPSPEPEAKPAPRRTKAVIPKELRWAVWERDDFTCLDCGTRRNLSIDHVIPESQGGPTTLDNLKTRCVPCNSRKGTRRIDPSPSSA